MGKRYLVSAEIEELEDAPGYLAICPEIPGCHAEGASIAEAIQNLGAVAKVVLEFRMDKGLGLPEGLQELGPGPIEVRAQLVVPVG